MEPEGVILESEQLRIRVVDNQPRLLAATDRIEPGYNGLACLLHRGQRRNVLSHAGLNFEAQSGLDGSTSMRLRMASSASRSSRSAFLNSSMRRSRTPTAPRLEAFIS